MTTKTANPHTWFFAYMRNIQGNEDRDEIRKALVFDYSNGKTESLVELYTKYPRQYRQMRQDLCTPQKKTIDQLDVARKRLIAAIFGNLEQRGYKGDMNYVKSIACKGAKIEKFNDIPLNMLKNLYNRFKNKNLQNDLDELITSISL